MKLLADTKKGREESRYFLDRRKLLLDDSVKSFASGQWDGEPFNVQVIAMPPEGDSLPSRELEFTFIVICDRYHKLTIRIRRELLPIIGTISLESRYIYNAEVEDFPVIRIQECQYNLVAKTKLLEESPGKLSRGGINSDKVW